MRVCAIANTFAFLFTFNSSGTEEIPGQLLLILVNPRRTKVPTLSVRVYETGRNGSCSMIKRAISPLNASAAEYAKMRERAGRKQVEGLSSKKDMAVQ